METKLLRDRLKNGLIQLAKAVGRYADWPEGSRRMVRAEPIWFEGDLPAGAGSEMNQYPLRFELTPARVTKVYRVLYTGDGMAWVRGRLERRYSIQEVGVRHILAGGGRRAISYDHATILQSDAPRTYGDWVSDHLASIAAALSVGEIGEPLLLPLWWHDKPYVKRDLSNLGIRAESVIGSAFIEHATVIHKTRPWLWWTKDESEAVRRVLNVVSTNAAPGTAVYLSRSGIVGEGPQRQFDNELVERAMTAAGVKVIRTKDQTNESYRALAASAETVFADHGSALYNMLYWRPRRIVELFAPSYWESSFLVLARTMGICDYHLWQIDSGTTVDSLTNRIISLRATLPPEP